MYHGNINRHKRRDLSFKGIGKWVGFFNYYCKVGHIFNHVFENRAVHKGSYNYTQNIS